MAKPRLHLLALGGTIATQPGERDMKMGLSADDLLRMVPNLGAFAEIRTETVSRKPSSDLLLEDLYPLAARIQAMADAGESDGDRVASQIVSKMDAQQTLRSRSSLVRLCPIFIRAAPLQFRAMGV